MITIINTIDIQGRTQRGGGGGGSCPPEIFDANKKQTLRFYILIIFK